MPLNQTNNVHNILYACKEVILIDVFPEAHALTYETIDQFVYLPFERFMFEISFINKGNNPLRSSQIREISCLFVWSLNKLFYHS